ncbi:hypothetical protein ANANG_G00055690 [Anguilla anguilla]|uniref:Uncharacterized protein n=1 Tax=Anguilla anguilla TaxID=7936 RepID=A0A9D3MMW6_ANGAN|nr:hypothetical protein ANANG_G00055690 [Anguilla anguilla]
MVASFCLEISKQFRAKKPGEVEVTGSVSRQLRLRNENFIDWNSQHGYGHGRGDQWCGRKPEYLEVTHVNMNMERT